MHPEHQSSFILSYTASLLRSFENPTGHKKKREHDNDDGKKLWDGDIIMQSALSVHPTRMHERSVSKEITCSNQTLYNIHGDSVAAMQNNIHIYVFISGIMT